MTTDAFADLAAAVRRDDVERAASILAANPSLSSRLDDPAPGEGFGATILRHPVEHGRRAMIDVLVRAGADVNARSHWWAGSFGVMDIADPSLVPFLLERGAVMTPHAAARLGLVDELERILRDDPAAVHARGGDGQLPLHFAADPRIANLLLDAGADVDAIDVDHESTAAQWAIRDRGPVARFLVSRGAHADILMASALGDADRVRHYLDADPASVRTSVTERYFPKRSPRAAGTIYIWTLGANKLAHTVAREFGHDDVFELLLSRSSPSLALVVACESGDEARVRSLLAGHPGLASRRDDEDLARLAMAAMASNAEAVRLFLSAGWPVGATMPNRVTALHWAGFHGDVPVARLLLERGAPLDVHDAQFDGTPLDWALHGSLHGWGRAESDYAAVVGSFLDAGAEVPTRRPIRASDLVLAELRRRGVDA